MKNMSSVIDRPQELNLLLLRRKLKRMKNIFMSPEDAV